VLEKEDEMRKLRKKGRKRKRGRDRVSETERKRKKKYIKKVRVYMSEKEPERILCV
jgi:hypothetical protein